MATQTISSVSISVSKRWDVYLSFRGVDTGLNFTSHLCAALDRSGIQMFMHDSKQQSQESISLAVLEAIKDSKAYIVVFSKNYASSSWCLDELTEILECSKTMGRLVLPIFCYIEPSVVRHQIGSYAEDFKIYEGSHVDKVKKWRITLSQVAEFSGIHIVAGKRSEADIVNEIVDRILLEINPATLDIAKYPVGIDSRIKVINPWLCSGTQGVLRIGIYGMRGVGKTTLAKAVYNNNYHRFQGSSFLANVGEVAGQRNGLENLQEQLVADVLKSKKIRIHNVDRGLESIKEKICSKKILIVLDGIDHLKQFDSLVGGFASGSVVIVTARDEGLLDILKVEHRYMVKELDDVDSLELFTKHAFGNIQPSDIYKNWSEDILPHTGGLPLALVVFASNLSNQPEEGWRYFIEKLDRNFNSSIQEKLKISFNALI